MVRIISSITAFIILLLAAPFLLLYGIIIQFSYPGPVFYSQERIGYQGKAFRIWKLRTMKVNAEKILETLIENDPAIKAEWDEFGCLQKDPRVAGKIGKFARESSFDEVPQLWNIVRGELRFVGPRPLPEEFVKTFSLENQDLRASIYPGLTGLWQVGPRSTVNHDQMLRIDKIYIRNKSLFLDLKILLKTVAVVFKRTGF